MNVVIDYFKNSFQFAAEAWNRFWFSETNPKLICGLRIVVGLIGIVWILSFSADRESWFSKNGLQQDDAVQTIMESDLRVVTANEGFPFLEGASRWSVLRWGSTPNRLWMIHVFAVAVFVTFTLGLGTTVSGILAWGMAVSYIHRSPLLSGPFENVFTFALLYLTITSSGRFWSVDFYWKKDSARPSHDVIRNSIGIRLLQFHLSVVYLFSAFSKLGGDVWWQGEAVWWMIAQPERCLSDFTSMQQNLGDSFQLVMNVWTYAIILAELAMGSLVWFRRFRPLLVPFSCVIWLSLIPIAGNVGYCLLMAVLNVAFLDFSIKPKVTNDDNQT